MFETIPDKYLDKVYFDPVSGCWIWCGARNSDGYGHVYIQYKHVQIHRFFYEKIKNIIITDDLTVDHLCKIRCCVNPDHMEIVTLEINKSRSNSPPAENARKTHCPEGHPYTGDNLYIERKGGRKCRICTRIANLKWAKKPEIKERRNARRRERRAAQKLLNQQ